ncbi:MAG: hypothetical protein HY284_02830 [Nitrospirae bacterium]|nr:hypothetical protein [Nitrospirota bacterium]
MFVVLPVILYSPQAALQLATPGMVAILSAVGILLGFVLDALKLYQWSPGYEVSKKEYFDSIAELVGGDPNKARSISSLSVRLEKELNGGEIFFQHSRWVMVTVFGTLFCFAGAVGVLAGFALATKSVEVGARFIASSVVAAIFGWRMFRTAKAIRDSVNNGYLHFLKSNRAAHGLPDAEGSES